MQFPVVTRSLSIIITEALYMKLVETARGKGHTPASYGKLLFEAAWSARQGPTGDAALDRSVATIDQPKPRDAEGEAMQAMATKALQREVGALKVELARADARITELTAEPERDGTAELASENASLKQKLQAVEDALSTAKADLKRVQELHAEACKKIIKAETERDEARGRAEGLLTDLEAANKRSVENLQTDPNACLNTPFRKEDTSVSTPLTAAQAKRARTYLGNGLSTIEVAEIMGCDVAAVQAVRGSKT